MQQQEDNKNGDNGSVFLDCRSSVDRQTLHNDDEEEEEEEKWRKRRRRKRTTRRSKRSGWRNRLQQQTDGHTDGRLRSSAPVTGYDYWLNDDDDYDDNDDDDDDTCFLPAHLRGRGAEKAAGSAATSAPTATCGAKRRSPFGFRPTREGGGGGGGTN